MTDMLVAASGFPVADDPHSRVHQGIMYHCSSLNTNLANDANFDMAITTPADDAIHMIIEAAGGALCDFLFYEGASITGGNVETVFNLKRTSSREWGGTMVTAPTVNDLGELLSAQVMPGGSKNSAVGGTTGFDLEWICKVSTTYLVRVTNRSGSATRVSIGCNHYSSAPILDAPDNLQTPQSST